MMFGIFLFLGANAAILLLISVVFSVLGVEGLLRQNGMDLDLGALLIYSVILGMSGSAISLFASKWMAKRSMGVRLIERPTSQTERWILATVERQASEAGISMPEVGIFDHSAPNAFATGWNRDSALVAVSTGLLNTMDAGQVEAVLAHEVSHAANGDMVTMALLQGVMNTFVIFLSRVVGFVVDRMVFRTQRGHGIGFYIVSLVMEVVFGFIAMMIVMWFSRWREFRADAGGAKLAGRENMIGALERLRAVSGGPPLPEDMRALAINAGKVQMLFASHPPLEKRIAALRDSGSAGSANRGVRGNARQPGKPRLGGRRGPWGG